MDVFGTDVLTSDLIAGKEAAFELLWDRLGPRLLRVALTISCSHADAEDAVQDAFVGLVKMGSNLASVRNLDAYLFTAVQRNAAARSGRRRREFSIDALLEPAAAIECDPCDAERLQCALCVLSPEQRTIVALKVDGELTFEEIAGVLGINANTAASRYRYALEKLRTVLTPDVAQNARHERKA
jgi:RNA polymerase sigma-70 factor (ECF subfamily)